MWLALWLALSNGAGDPPPARVTALFFITLDCPIANSYAPKLQTLCEQYRRRGVACKLVYADPSLTAERVQKHARDYGLAGIAAVVDREHKLVKAYQPKVTPEAVVLLNGKPVYRGRIDDRWVGWGQKRQQANREDLRDALDRALAGNTAWVETKAVGCWIADLAIAGSASPPVTR